MKRISVIFAAASFLFGTFAINAEETNQTYWRCECGCDANSNCGCSPEDGCDCINEKGTYDCSCEKRQNEVENWEYSS